MYASLTLAMSLLFLAPAIASARALDYLAVGLLNYREFSVPFDGLEIWPEKGAIDSEATGDFTSVIHRGPSRIECLAHFERDSADTNTRHVALTRCQIKSDSAVIEVQDWIDFYARVTPTMAALFSALGPRF